MVLTKGGGSGYLVLAAVIITGIAGDNYLMVLTALERNTPTSETTKITNERCPNTNKYKQVN